MNSHDNLGEKTEKENASINKWEGNEKGKVLAFKITKWSDFVKSYCNIKEAL